jgi:hypothetical protein
MISSFFECLRSVLKYFWVKIEKFAYLMQIVFLILSAIAGFYVFIYQDRIKPTYDPPQLTVTSHLEQVGEKDSMIVLKGNLIVKNPGKSRVIVLAAYYNLIGYKLDKEALDDWAYARLLQKQIREELPFPNPLCYSIYEYEIHASRYRKGERNFLNNGNLLIGGWLDPGDQYTREYVFFVPKGKYDMAQLQFDVYVTKDYQIIGWQDVNDFMKVEMVPCSSGELDADLMVKDYCRFCDLGKKEWRAILREADVTYRNQFHKDFEWLHSDALVDLPLMPTLIPSPRNN